MEWTGTRDQSAARCRFRSFPWSAGAQLRQPFSLSGSGSQQTLCERYASAFHLTINGMHSESRTQLLGCNCWSRWEVSLFPTECSCMGITTLPHNLQNVNRCLQRIHISRWLSHGYIEAVYASKGFLIHTMTTNDTACFVWHCRLIEPSLTLHRLRSFARWYSSLIILMLCHVLVHLFLLKISRSGGVKWRVLLARCRHYWIANMEWSYDDLLLIVLTKIGCLAVLSRLGEPIFISTKGHGVNFTASRFLALLPKVVLRWVYAQVCKFACIVPIVIIIITIV